MWKSTVGNITLQMSAISFEKLYEKHDITDFNVHNISVLLCSFPRAYFVMLDWFSEDSEVPHSVFSLLKDFSLFLSHTVFSLEKVTALFHALRHPKSSLMFFA